MQYLAILLIFMLNSCQQPEIDANRVLDTGAYDIMLTIARDLKTAELSSKIEAVPKKYRLQLHAFINSERPLGKDAEEKFLPLVFAYVVFSYLQGQPPATTVHTCVMKNVAVGMPHTLETKHCTTGDALLQKVRACVADETKHFKIAEHDQKSVSCESTTASH